MVIVRTHAVNFCRSFSNLMTEVFSIPILNGKGEKTEEENVDEDKQKEELEKQNKLKKNNNTNAELYNVII